MFIKKLLYLLVTVTCLSFLYRIFQSFDLWLIKINLPKSFKLRNGNSQSKESLPGIHSLNRKDTANSLLYFRKKIVRQCSPQSEPQKSIFYIKVHKTGSTTMRTLLLEYGLKYNLTTCMDAFNLWGLNWPYNIDETKLTKMYNEKCGIVAEELVYNPQVVSRIMDDNVFIMASVRHPIEHFLSLYKYSNIQKAVEKLVNKKLEYYESMRIFLKYPKTVKNIYATFEDNEVRDKLQLNMVEPNLQLYSFGLRSTNVHEIKRLLSGIDFITVAEKWNESMVVLKEKLCCSFNDVVYRKQNVRRSKTKQQNIPDDIKHAILKFNNGDLLLYGLVQRRLLEEIQAVKNFENKLKEYKDTLNSYEKKCALTKNLCPPTHSGDIGYHVTMIRKKQKENLLFKLRESYFKT